MFDALEELVKARKAKGLDNWKKLEHLAAKLAGKHGKHISFTCSHPSHGKSGDKHNLGSKEGNLHFLMGYVNPGFYLAPYHWQIIYPDLSEEELASFAAEKGHPAQSRLWESAALDAEAEGDLDEGSPHPYFLVMRNTKAVKDRSIKAKSRYNSYTADPVEGLITESGTERVYSWELVKNSFFAYENPKVVAAMEAAKPDVVEKSVLPEPIKHLVKKGAWGDVYPLVKSLFPKPGSVVTIPSGQETLYGLVRPASIELLDAAGHPVAFEQYDRVYKSLDLRKDGDIHPSILYNFAVRYLGVDGEHLEGIVKSLGDPAPDSFPSVVEGFPSAGYEHVPATNTENLNKSVVVEDHTFRLVIED